MKEENAVRTNKEFYSYCSIYFGYLRKKGRNDFAFEDEYYYTMPAISSRS